MSNQKNLYIFSGPVTAFTVILLLAGNILFYCLWQTKPMMQAKPFDLPLPVFSTGDTAVFCFTRDTVMVLAPADPINLAPAWKVLYKDGYGDYQTENLPQSTLGIPLPDNYETDTK